MKIVEESGETFLNGWRFSLRLAHNITILYYETIRCGKNRFACENFINIPCQVPITTTLDISFDDINNDGNDDDDDVNNNNNRYSSAPTQKKL